MKTFKEFCEQAKYNPFSPSQKPNVVQQFMNRVGASVNNRIRSAQETGEMAAAALDPRNSPLERHMARTDLLFKLRGGNYRNPDNMPTKGPKDRKSYSLRQFIPDRDLPPKINPPPKGLPSTGRELRNILPGGKIA